MRASHAIHNTNNIRCNSNEGDDIHIEGNANDDHKPKHPRKFFYILKMDLLPRFISPLPPTDCLCSFVKESKDNGTEERQNTESQTYRMTYSSKFCDWAILYQNLPTKNTLPSCSGGVPSNASYILWFIFKDSALA
jgi:hypothetical protein